MSSPIHDQRKLKIAYHETGHAVMALLCQQGIKSVSLKEMDSPKGTDKYYGSTILEPFEQNATLTINELTRRVMISLGGYASEILLLGGAGIGGDDLTSAVGWIEAMMQSEDFRAMAARLPAPDPGVLDDLVANPMIRACVDYQVRLCVNELGQFKRPIQQVAVKLYERDELSGHEFADLFNSFAQAT